MSPPTRRLSPAWETGQLIVRLLPRGHGGGPSHRLVVSPHAPPLSPPALRGLRAGQTTAEKPRRHGHRHRAACPAALDGVHPWEQRLPAPGPRATRSGPRGQGHEAGLGVLAELLNPVRDAPGIPFPKRRRRRKARRYVFEDKSRFHCKLIRRLPPVAPGKQWLVKPAASPGAIALCSQEERDPGPRPAGLVGGRGGDAGPPAPGLCRTEGKEEGATGSGQVLRGQTQCAGKAREGCLRTGGSGSGIFLPLALAWSRASWPGKPQPVCHCRPWGPRRAPRRRSGRRRTPSRRPCSTGLGGEGR